LKNNYNFDCVKILLKNAQLMHTDAVTSKALTASATYTTYAPLFAQDFALSKFNSFPT